MNATTNVLMSAGCGSLVRAFVPGAATVYAAMGRLSIGAGVIAVALFSVAAGAQELGWQTYVNDRFGYSVDIPTDYLRPLPPPENGDGLGFESADGAVTLSVFGSNNALEWTFDEYYEAALARDDLGRVTYQRKAERWYVLSGYRTVSAGNGPGEAIFYERVAIDSRGRAISGLLMQFPPSLKDFMDPIVTRISRSLTPPSSPDG